MTNDFYLIARALYKASYLKFGSGLLYVLKPAGRGKTHTRDAIRRDCTKCKLVPPSTEAGLYEFFSKNSADCMFIIDDKSEWMIQDFGNGIAYLKMVGTGKLRRLRMSKFTIEEGELDMCCIGVLSLNTDQANGSAFKLRETGFTERALKLKISHNKRQYEEIKKAYSKYGFNRHNLPHFKIPADFWKESPGGIDEDIESWILDNFNSEASDTVKLIAKVVSRDAFERLKPCLLSGVTETEFKEDIEFEVE